MTQQPELYLSHRDYDRLWQLLDRLADKTELTSNLGDELDRATLLQSEDVPKTVVTMNSKVRFLNEDSQKEHELELVFPSQITGETGKISILTPAGSALIGLSIGDSIEWPLAQKKTLRLKIIDVCHPVLANDNE